METARFLIAGLLYWIVAVCLLSLFIAVVLRAAAKWVENRDLNFDSAFWTALFGVLANAVLARVVLFALLVTAVATESQAGVYAASALLCPPALLIQAEIIARRLRIPFRRACLVGLTMVLILLVMAAILGMFMMVLSLFIR